MTVLWIILWGYALGLPASFYAARVEGKHYGSVYVKEGLGYLWGIFLFSWAGYIYEWCTEFSLMARAHGFRSNKFFARLTRTMFGVK